MNILTARQDNSPKRETSTQGRQRLRWTLIIIIESVCDPRDILCISNIFQASISPGICLTDNSKLNFLGCVALSRYQSHFFSLYIERSLAGSSPASLWKSTSSFCSKTISIRSHLESGQQLAECLLLFFLCHSLPPPSHPMNVKFKKPHQLSIFY